MNTKILDLSGSWQVRLKAMDSGVTDVRLPGSLDENGVGHPDTGDNLWHAGEHQDNADTCDGAGGPGDDHEGNRPSAIATRLTRRFVYEGEAVFFRYLDEELPRGKRLFLEVERSRVLTLNIDGRQIPALRGSLSTPWVFEVTDTLTKGSLISFTCDNSYRGLPREDIVYSSAATDETATDDAASEEQAANSNKMTMYRIRPFIKTL